MCVPPVERLFIVDVWRDDPALNRDTAQQVTGETLEVLTQLWGIRMYKTNAALASENTGRLHGYRCISYCCSRAWQNRWFALHCKLLTVELVWIFIPSLVFVFHLIFSHFYCLLILSICISRLINHWCKIMGCARLDHRTGVWVWELSWQSVCAVSFRQGDAFVPGVSFEDEIADCFYSWNVLN